MNPEGQSKAAQLVGFVVAAVAVVGYVGFGWRFGGESSPVAVGLALVAVAAAAYFTIRGE
jgi:phosphoglycerol transferase MdoB-like AlkP superfamily enzyme